MIRQIDELPKGETSGSKMEAAIKDIREIIEKRIQRSVIVKSPFTESSTYEGYKRAIRKAVLQVRREKQTCRVPDWDCFKVIKKTVDGVTFWYIIFDVEKWDIEWAMIAEREGKA